ncbi:MAG: tRNA 4-thiouridine(8) synthase ThiI, partial [Anaerolineae bacterium]|nr:tRNA 4-thiouridine(8) synthase ThiI [Anaerolineae bacterium]
MHYGEVGLKGHNRIHFERRLVGNIRTALGDLPGPTVQRFHSYIKVSIPDEGLYAEVERRLSHIPGIVYFAPVTVTPLDMAAITEAAVALAAGTITPETSFRVRTTRGNKQFPLTSPEIDRRVGGEVQDMTHAPVDLSNPDMTLSIQIYEDEAYLFARRIAGPGGLPVGSSGRVLVLFSGGIDSPVAAHLMMKRGCAVDFLHFHLLRGKEQIRKSKVVAMARQVLAPHRTPARLYMVSSAPFEAAMAPLDSRVATVV